MHVAAERRKQTYDIRVRESDVRVGDWVWYWYPRRFLRKSSKWQRSYVGPFLVVRKIEPTNFVLQRTVKAKPFVVHISKVKTFLGPTPPSWLQDVNGSTAPLPPPSPAVGDEPCSLAGEPAPNLDCPGVTNIVSEPVVNEDRRGHLGTADSPRI